MNTFFTQVLQVNGDDVQRSVNVYDNAATMYDAAAKAAIDETTISDSRVVVAVVTSKGTGATFEVKIEHQITTRTRKLPATDPAIAGGPQ